MSQVAHNRLRGRGLYMEVMDVITKHDGVITNIGIRDVLVVRYPELRDAAPETLFRLYERIVRATDQLHGDGRVIREEAIGENKHIKYEYKCSV
jgi:hypothetical protein